MATLSSIIAPNNVTTATNTQTMTNKTLTSPTLTTPNITTGLTLTGSAGTAGQVLTSNGSGAPTWATAGGATGGGSDQIFQLNGKTVTTSYSIPSGKNAMSVGPITVSSGQTVTVPSGSRWVVL